MDDRDSHRSLSDMQARIDQAKRARTEKDRKADANAKAIGIRIGVELVVSVAFSGFIGWVLDRTFETAPWLMLLFIILGMAGGIRNVIRTAEQENKRVRDEQNRTNGK